MPKQIWTIGSHPACDLVVDNVTVSGNHCRLVQVGGSFTLEDLNSSNGTYVNGERLQGSKKVSKKDRITLGKTQPMPWPPEFDGPRDKGQTIGDANLQVITIGRAPNNTLVINESNVSSVHAKLTISNHEIVLEDLGSTNGTSVGKVENKITRATVQPGDVIFLGSTAHLVTDLISKANSAAKASPSPPAPKATKSKAIRPKGWKTPNEWKSNTPAKIGLAGVGGVVLILALWMALSGHDSGSNNQTASVAETNTKDPISDSAKSKPIELSKKEDVVSPETESEALAISEKLSRSLFLLVCADQEGKTPFRVGTAFAIDSKHVATSASVISVMRELQKNGFPKVKLYNPKTNEELNVVSSRVHPQYEIATSEARLAQQKHDGILDELESKPPNPDSFEAVKEQLLSARLKAMEAIERQTTCDVGIIEVEPTLKHWLVGNDSISSLRPRLKLNVTGFAFDIEDPYFDVSAPIKLSTMTSRVNQVFKWSSDSLQRLEATGSTEQLEYSYLGSPAINERGQVVAIYSRPIPPENEQGATSETKAVDAFDAPLFMRVRECLENQR